MRIRGSRGQRGVWRCNHNRGSHAEERYGVGGTEGSVKGGVSGSPAEKGGLYVSGAEEGKGIGSGKGREMVRMRVKGEWRRRREGKWIWGGKGNGKREGYG